MANRSRKAVRLASWFMALFLLAACGQKGGLVRPEAAESLTHSGPAAVISLWVSLVEPITMDHFLYRGEELFAEDVAVAEIAESAGRPCFVYSRATLERHWLRAACRRYRSRLW